jgi:hypothetical protein
MTRDQLIEHVLEYAAMIVKRGDVSKLRAVHQVMQVLSEKQIFIGKSTVQNELLKLGVKS